MHTEVFNNIDILMNMANSSLNIDEVSSELISIKRQIKSKKAEIEDLKSLMTEARYFNASNELVDKNIEISLKSKISRLNRKLKTLKNDLEDLQKEENSLHKNITSLKTKLATNEKYVKTLEIKSNSTENNAYYSELLKKEQDNVAILNTELKEKTAKYEELLQELETISNNHTNLNNQLATEKERLNDVLDNLSNPNTYIDEDLKHEDEERLTKLNEDLEGLEKRKVELLTDATMIGTDAKKLIIDNDIYEALNKIKELVKVVKTKPYMDINTPNILEEELEKKESLRVELSTLIDNKDYENLETDAITKRIDYLKNEIASHNESITEYQKEINKIDEFINKDLGNLITSLEEEIQKNEKSINDCREKIKDKNKSTRTRIAMESTISKKEQEKDIQNQILESYKNDLMAKITRTNTINAIISELNTEISNYNEELEELNKLTMLDLKTKDLAEEENDKEQLKQVNEEIKAIKNRQKYDKTPDEIYDQIEMILSSSIPKETREKKNASLDIDNLSLNSDNKETEIDTLDFKIPEIGELNAQKEENNSIETLESPVSENSNSNRLKVINMIPVETIKTELNKETDGGN